eukprot:COSAG01_NODE_63376_length_280_cov_0.823204_1_plen_45_part_10
MYNAIPNQMPARSLLLPLLLGALGADAQDPALVRSVLLGIQTEGG